MTCTERQELLNEYLDGDLSGEVQKEFERHLQSCKECLPEYEALVNVRNIVRAVPKDILPKRDLWNAIADRIGKPERASVKEKSNAHRLIDYLFGDGRGRYRTVAAFSLGMILIVLAGYWIVHREAGLPWTVSSIAGAPTISSAPFSVSRQIDIGEALVTDRTSRARIRLGGIGYMDVEPNSQVRLLNTRHDNHRLALDHGSIHASVSAPPRIFSVETPSATAVDLGCEYRLMVDEQGRSILLVTAGYVALEWNGRSSVVPAASECETRPGIGPGTPYSEYSSPAFRSALARFDFEQGGLISLDTVLSMAKLPDAITLWHLFARVDELHRGKLYDRLASLVPPPIGVTKDGIRQLDTSMLRKWWETFEPMPFPSDTETPSFLITAWKSVRNLFHL